MSLTAQQLETRRRGLGGSDCAAVFGLSPWKSRYQLWREKRGLDTNDAAASNEPAFWGTALEDVVAAEYARRAGVRVQRMRKTLRSIRRPYMLAHLDRAIILPGAPGNVRWNGDQLNTREILEVKTADRFTADQWGEPDTDQVPVHYLLQGMHYLAVTKAEVCRFAVLIGGNDFRTYTVQRDDDLVRQIIDTEAEFWSLVEQGIEPPAESDEDIRIKYRQDAGTTIEATPEIATTVQQLREAKAALEVVEAEVERYEGEIKGYMREAATLTVAGAPACTWRTTKPRKTFDRKNFDVSHPGLYDQFCRDGETSRRFLIKEA